MTKNEILDYLHEVFEGSPWFGNSISAYLQEIESEMLNFSFPGGNSVGQVFDHMILWREFVMDKLNALDHNQIPVQTQSQFEAEDWPGKTFKESDKNVLFAKIRATQKALVQLIEAENDELLHKMVPGESYNFEFLLMGIMFHDTYHLGQLYMLTSSAKHSR